LPIARTDATATTVNIRVALSMLDSFLIAPLW
jgi:hypothetical protein